MSIDLEQARETLAKAEALNLGGQLVQSSYLRTAIAEVDRLTALVARLEPEADNARTMAADLAALRAEIDAEGAVIDATRAARDEARAEVAALRAHVADLTALGVSVHKATYIAGRAERANVVAYAERKAMAAHDKHSDDVFSALTQFAFDIEHGAHEGAAEVKASMPIPPPLTAEHEGRLAAEYGQEAVYRYYDERAWRIRAAEVKRG